MMQLTLHSKDTGNSEFQWPTVGLNYITRVHYTLVHSTTGVSVCIIPFLA